MRFRPLISAPRTIETAATPGELPAMTWIRRGGKARIRCTSPAGGVDDLPPSVQHVGSTELGPDLELHASRGRTAFGSDA